MVDDLVIHSLFGFRMPDLEFIRSWSVRRVGLFTPHVLDLSPIYRLRQLEELVAWPKGPGWRGVLDAGALPELRTLMTYWDLVKESVAEATSLRVLELDTFNDNDLTRLRNLGDLSELRLRHYPSLVSVNGIERLSALTKLWIGAARYLSDMSAIERAGRAGVCIRELRLEGVRKVADVNWLMSMPFVEDVWIDDCGEIESAAPFLHLPHLRRLVLAGDTKVGDLDLSPLLELPPSVEVRVAGRRGYQPSAKRVQEIRAAQSADS